MNSENLTVKIFSNPVQVSAAAWNGLLQSQDQPTPFMQHAYLQALSDSESAVVKTGWQSNWISLWQDDELVAACPLYIKSHSWGEYVFDWAWADAYEQLDQSYYPKAVISVPFTPVPGTRLLAKNAALRAELLDAAIRHCEALELSSLHLLFCSPADLEAVKAQSLPTRESVQFHWINQNYRDFDHFLTGLNQEKRKKIKQERAKVSKAGIHFTVCADDSITEKDWDFFYQCYATTYFEHRNAPYLTRDFFKSMQDNMASNWVMFTAHIDGQRVACSLIAVQNIGKPNAIAYGRYWGALKKIDSLHFETCYYQPIEWCIRHGIEKFEGGAQGEHKMSRALMPTKTYSAHWISDQRFKAAIDSFVTREKMGVEHYLHDLADRSPFKKSIS